MGKGRLEAFSDGVIAILITIMVLELKLPAGHEISAIGQVMPTLLSYLMSFVYLGIYWNNHHHLLHAVHKVNGATLWANLHLLFWLSLVPFATAWMGEAHFTRDAVLVYGVMLLMSAVAFSILVRVLLASHGQDSTLAKAIGDDRKGNISLLLYTTGIVLAWFVSSWLGVLAYVIVALIWLVPDRRIENVLR